MKEPLIPWHQEFYELVELLADMLEEVLSADPDMATYEETMDRAEKLMKHARQRLREEGGT